MIWEIRVSHTYAVWFEVASPRTLEAGSPKSQENFIVIGALVI